MIAATEGLNKRMIAATEGLNKRMTAATEGPNKRMIAATEGLNKRMIAATEAHQIEKKSKRMQLSFWMVNLMDSDFDFYVKPNYSKVISGFQALRQVEASVMWARTCDRLEHVDLRTVAIL
ncbi:hypothetical protein PoB_002106400 [Plakobranchus ocellatus]|uniref:Uncharacterized protein n=1 Tax=Plakobranchus ocellatus TaxID=259542 RepID=A0AAV3ZGW8_9GAST|nr:hypothetical protein PoB_002106400 [Plakobranchus ocellatus]